MDAISRQFQYLRSTLGQREAAGRETTMRLAGPTAADPVLEHVTIETSAQSPGKAHIAAIAAIRRPFIARPSMTALLIALGAVVGAKFLAKTERTQPDAPSIVAKRPADPSGATPLAPTAKHAAITRSASAHPAAAHAAKSEPVPVGDGRDRTGSIGSRRDAGPARQVGPTPMAASPLETGPFEATTPAVARLAGNSYFPEPRLVKTVTTDMRGRIIVPSDTVAVRPESLRAATLRAETAPAAPVAAQRPEKIAVRIEMPPEVDVNVAAAAPLPSGTSAAPAAAPATAVTDIRKPANVVETASFGRSTGISVQIAAAGTEEEARAVADRFEQRFAHELDGRKLSIIQATPKDRVVYRVRLTEVSRNEADVICSQLRASRMGCFVARD